MVKTPLSAGQRSDRARIAANTRWSRLSTAQRLKQTAPGRRAMFAYFEKLVDPDGLLSPEERTKLAENARKAQLASARLKRSKSRKCRQQKDIVGPVPTTDEAEGGAA
jgi:hypothetical protein